jgi:glycosyltransferase involved in cell wall biosynthesis
MKIKLKIVCSRNVFTKRFERKIKEIGAQEWVELLGFVADEKLKKLYCEALVFVWPSLLEGFGLPPLEAMANNCPVVSSEASCNREIYGEAAIYFEPENWKDLVRAIGVAVRRRERLRKLGQRQVEKYSWERAAEETRKIYESRTGL